MLDTPVKAKCAFCGRAAELWGGDTCDVCDSDSDGILDCYEPVASSQMPNHSLFDPPSDGFTVTASRMEYIFPTGNIRADTMLRARMAIVRRANSRVPTIVTNPTAELIMIDGRKVALPPNG